MTLDELLTETRKKLIRINAGELCGLMASSETNDLVVLDTRTPTDRATYGCIPGALHTPRTVLEWRVALDAPLRISDITNHDQLLVVVCNEGFSSSLAAATLQSLGFHRATDLIGGFMAWIDAAMPVVQPRNDETGVRNEVSEFAPLYDANSERYRDGDVSSSLRK